MSSLPSLKKCSIFSLIDKKEILMHLIEDAILNIEDDKRFRVTGGRRTMHCFWRMHKTEILDRVGTLHRLVRLRLSADATVEGK